MIWRDGGKASLVQRPVEQPYPQGWVGVKGWGKIFFPLISGMFYAGKRYHNPRGGEPFMSRRLIKFGVIIAALIAVLAPATVASAVPQHAILSGQVWCSGDVAPPGAWIYSSWGRARACVTVTDRSVEAYEDDTRTDGMCVTMEWNEFATTSAAFKAFPANTYVGATRSCGSIQHFVTSVADVYEGIWRIRLYRGTSFVTILDTHTARILQT